MISHMYVFTLYLLEKELITTYMFTCMYVNLQYIYIYIYIYMYIRVYDI